VPKFTLRKRERVILVVGTALVVVMLAYGGLRGPWKRYRQSGEDLKSARSRLEQARDMRDAVLEARQSHEVIVERLQRRGNFDLWTFLNDSLRRTGLVDRAALNNQPGLVRSASLSALKLTLEGVSLEELVKLLYTVYASDNLVVVYSLDNLHPTDEGEGLECTLVFVSPKA